MTVPRSRMGKACTEWKPAPSASAANRGQRLLADGEVLVHDRLAAAVTVQAGTFLGLQLEQFQEPHGLAGGGHHPQVAVGPGQHETGGGDVEHLDAAVGQPGQQLDHVEVRHQRVGQLHQRPDEQRLFGIGPPVTSSWPPWSMRSITYRRPSLVALAGPSHEVRCHVRGRPPHWRRRNAASWPPRPWPRR